MHKGLTAVPEPMEQSLALTYEAAIREFEQAWEINPEHKADYKVRYDIAVAITEAECGIPALYPRIRSVASKIDWVLFGDKGISLPEGMALQTHSDRNGILYQNGDYKLVDTVTVTKPSDFEIVLHLLQDNGLVHVARDIGQERQHKYGAIREEFAKAVRLSPPMQFFYGFLNPTSEPTDRSLTPFEKSAQLASMTGQIKTKHGILETSNLRYHANALKELGRHALLLDDATVREGIKNPEDEVLALRSYFEAAVYELNDYDGATSQHNLVDLRNGTPQANYVQKLIDDLCPNKGVDIYDPYRLIRKVISSVFSKDQSMPLSTRLDEICRELFPWSINKLEYMNDDVKGLVTRRQILAKVPIVDKLNFSYDLPAFNFPRGSAYNDANYEMTATSESASDSIIDSPTIVERATYERDKAVTLATVERFGKHKDNALRLLGKYPLEPMHADSTSQTDLRVHFTGAKPSRINGYRMISLNTSTGTAEYSRMADDPYREATVAIDFEAQAKLLKAVERLDIPGLASALSKSGLTVAKLVATIREFGDYSFNEASETIEGNPGVSILNGRLQMQCTGAAKLLTDLLDAVEPGSAKVVTGKVLLPGASKIDAAGHAQVSYLDSKTRQRFYLDATPSFREYTVEQHEVAEVNDASSIDAYEADVIIPVLQRVESLPGSLKPQMEMSLQPRLGTHDKADLYDKLDKLRADDPIKITMSAVIGAELKSAKLEWYDNPQRLINYLDTISREEVDYLNSVGITQYTPDTLRMLKSFAQRLLDQPKV